MDLIVLADPDGVVDMTHEALARITNVPMERIKAAITKLETPDLKSRTPDYEGIRLKRLDDHRDWGWLIVNYARFRGTATEEKRREQTRDRVRKFREKQTSRNALQPLQETRDSSSTLHTKTSDGNALHRVTSSSLCTSSSDSGSVQEGGGGEGIAAKYHKDARVILHALNEAAGRHYRETDANLTIVSQRLKEDGVTTEGVLMMIQRQCQKWKTTDMEEYLRPETLFAKRKFDGYYAARAILPTNKLFTKDRQENLKLRNVL